MSLQPSTAQFFLPGLIHHFGNTLLTLQGQMLRVQADPGCFERTVGGLVERGAASLTIMRVLLGERNAGSAAAAALMTQLVDLGRVPAREHGIRLELRGDAGTTETAVDAVTFVRCCAEAIRVWVSALPTGAEGALTARLREADGAAVVTFAFETAGGTLPFPAPFDEVETTLTTQPWFPHDTVALHHCDDAFELRFRPTATSQAWEA